MIDYPDDHYKNLFYDALDVGLDYPLHNILRDIPDDCTKHKVIMLSRGWKRSHDAHGKKKLLENISLERSAQTLYINAHLNAHKATRVISEGLNRLILEINKEHLTGGDISTMIKTAGDSLKLLKSTEVVVKLGDIIEVGEQCMSDSENALVAEIENMIIGKFNEE